MVEFHTVCLYDMKKNICKIFYGNCLSGHSTVSSRYSSKIIYSIILYIKYVLDIKKYIKILNAFLFALYIRHLKLHLFRLNLCFWVFETHGYLFFDGHSIHRLSLQLVVKHPLSVSGGS